MPENDATTTAEISSPTVQTQLQPAATTAPAAATPEQSAATASSAVVDDTPSDKDATAPDISTSSTTASTAAAPAVIASAAASKPSATSAMPHRSRQMEHFNRIRENVKKAIAAKHTFMIHGRSRIVREALLARNWCEKMPRKASPPGDQQQQLGVDSSPSGLLAGIGDLSEPQNERLLISKMLSNHIPDLLWNAGSDWIGWPAQDNKNTIFNRYTRANFTSKIGLCLNVRQMHWYYEAGIANTLFPRCYNISQSDQMQAFVEDFRMTACLSLLKWLVECSNGSAGELEARTSSSGLVPLRALDFAIGRCSDFIGSKSHEDIDHELEKVWSHQWEQFIGWYYKLVHHQASFVAGPNNPPGNPHSLHKYVMAARHLLRKLRQFWPQLDMDGSLNIWILKPGNKSRGRGIVLMNRLDDILAKVSPNNKTNDTRFVVQKYIERPLLIYETKFDIRQWFVVTNAQPLTVWMYRESYLRFCSQKFSLRDFHESIHLSNNAVQCKYKNSPDRAPELPVDNMWDVASFKQFLVKRGDPDAWEQIIYPGIKQGLIGSLLASQEAMDRRKNSFELYGADFMVMEDYSVWLIEINSHPDMSNSTSVTSRLCRKAMEDIIKVVVDYRENPNTADTGDFELVYKQKLSCNQAYLGTGLSLHGTRIQTASSTNLPSYAAISAASSNKRKPSVTTKTPVCHVSPALIDLIEELELQLDHEFHEYLKLRQTSVLSRQGLPLAITSAHDEKPCIFEKPDQIDVETNTASKTIDLGIVQSLSGQAPNANFDALMPPDQLHSAETKRSPRTGNSNGQRTSNYTSKNHRNNLISKIIDLQRTTANPQSHKNAKSRITQPPPALIQHSPNNQPLNKTDKSASSNKDKSQEKNNRVISSKFVPPIPNALATSSRNKLSNKLRVKDKKIGHSRKRSRPSSSQQVLIDVTDMYAIGLSVSK